MTKNIIERGLIYGFSTVIETPKRGAGFKTDGQIDMNELYKNGGSAGNELYRIKECSYVVYEKPDGGIKVEARRGVNEKAIADAILEIEKRMKNH